MNFLRTAGLSGMRMLQDGCLKGTGLGHVALPTMFGSQSIISAAGHLMAYREE